MGPVKLEPTAAPAANSIPLAGMRFGRLSVLGFSRRRGRHLLWACRCDCGREIDVQGSNLRSGHSTSCKSCAARVHGMTHIPEYRIWSAMIQRCTNPRERYYANYGGRGILVCDRWRDSFANFYADMGPRPPQLTLERSDNDRGYEPDNCIWATREQQNRNQRTNVFVEINGERRILTDWCRHFGIAVTTVLARTKRGIDMAAAITTPARPRKPRSIV